MQGRAAVAEDEDHGEEVYAEALTGAHIERRLLAGLGVVLDACAGNVLKQLLADLGYE